MHTLIKDAALTLVGGGRKQGATFGGAIGLRFGVVGQKLACVCFEDEPGRRSAAKLLSKAEARRIAANVAKLPDLSREPPPS